MKTVLFTLFLVFAGTYSFSQTNKTPVIPTTEATYPGGSDAMIAYLQKNLVVPKDKKNIEGKVYVEFNIDKEGKVKDAKVMKGIDPKLDEVALNAVSRMPNWIPAKDANGAPMDSRMFLPIKFTK